MYIISINISVLMLCYFKPFRFYQNVSHSYENVSIFNISQFFIAIKKYIKSRLTNGGDFIKEFLPEIMKGFTIKQ